MQVREATVAISKCREAHKIYGVRFEKVNSNKWKYTWAFPIKKDSAKREKYDETVIKGDLVPDEEYPGCPYCGSKYFLICSCGRISCNVGFVNGVAVCDWCGTSGVMSAYDGAGVKSGRDR